MRYSKAMAVLIKSNAFMKLYILPWCVVCGFGYPAALQTQLANLCGLSEMREIDLVCTYAGAVFEL